VAFYIYIYIQLIVLLCYMRIDSSTFSFCAHRNKFTKRYHIINRIILYDVDDKMVASYLLNKLSVENTSDTKHVNLKEVIRFFFFHNDYKTLKNILKTYLKTIINKVIYYNNDK